MKKHLLFMLFVAAISVVYPQKKNQKALTPEMIKVEGGTFNMGSDEELDFAKPVHKVTLNNFLIGKYEVTQDLWESVMGSNPSKFKGAKRPVENVSWYDAVEFCNKLSEKEGLTPVYKIDKNKKDSKNTNTEKDPLRWTITCNFNENGYRLPSEAEWEYAARGGNMSKGYKYSGSNSIDEVAWYGAYAGHGNREKEKSSAEAGKKKPNELGIYDMSGNVEEWCWDWYGDYKSENKPNPVGPGFGGAKVNRGGSWYSYGSECIIAARSFNATHSQLLYIGFRVVRTK